MRVLSYNIHKGIGGRDRRYRPDRVLAAIARERPDVVCLQEVDRGVKRSDFHDQPALFAERLADRLGLAGGRIESFDRRGEPLTSGDAADPRPVHAAYQFNVKVRGGGYGNLILSRWPLHTRAGVCLRKGRRKPRGAQVVTVDTPAGPLRLVNWHLGLAEKERHWQVEKLLSDEAFCAGDALPSLIVGDFNDWRNTLAAGPFAAHGFVKLTWPPSRFRSFPAWLPVGSLDKAFARGPLMPDAVRVAHNRFTREASDHLPLVVDFHLGTEGVRRTDG